MSGAIPFLGYTVEPAGCSLYCGPGALALLKIIRLGGGAASCAALRLIITYVICRVNTFVIIPREAIEVNV
ncbi:hypothetical protein CFB49_09735 [Burkholderia sp. AU17457]|nr:hypothetical protein CFB49_09735 [Burkholderia sp. AU17457]